MDAEDQAFLREFFGNVSDRALEPDDAFYVELYADPERDDPVELLARGIEWTPVESVQLFSGFRGTGKSTQLRRLRKLLQAKGYVVVLIDIDDYVNLHTAVDISDFLIALAGAFDEGLAEAGFPSPEGPGYWERLSRFVRDARVDVQDLSLGAGGVGIKASLKQDPTFRETLQRRLAGHLSALVADVRKFVAEGARRVLDAAGPEAAVVFLVDSVEHIRGTSSNADEVHASVENLFAGHADKLKLPGLHTVYTVPPYLKVRYPGVSRLYEPGGLQIQPAVKVRDRDGKPWRPGLHLLADLVEQRGDWRRLLASREQLDELILKSGGHLRDLLRILAEIVRRAKQLPVRDETRVAAVDQIRNELLPISDSDARWLLRVSQTHEAALSDGTHLPDLARFLDTQLVLVYRNGEEWYDVHPLIVEQVADQVRIADNGTGRPPDA